MTNRRPLFALLVTLALPTPVWAQADAGAYLAGRQAGYQNDFSAVTTYFTEALKGDPTNPALLESTLIGQIGLGRFDLAQPLAQKMVDQGITSQTAHIALAVTAGQAGEWDKIFAALEAGQTVGPLADGLSQAWAFVGQGQMTEALAAFDAVVNAEGLKPFGLYHKALGLAVVGDYEGADAILSLGPDQGLPRTRRAAFAHAQILSQLGRNPDALTMLETVFGRDPDPSLAQLRDRLAAGETIPFSLVTDAHTGLAEVYLSIAVALDGDADDAYTLIYARAAEALNPVNTDAILVTANLLDRIGRYDMASATYARVAPDDPAFHAAELGRADVLRKDGKLDTAIEVLQALTRSHASLPMVQATLGDLLRQKEDFAGANAAYTAALGLMGDGDPAAWFVHYTRGITYERLDQWPAAEADFRAALALNPGQPAVLNYLGYSMVEQQVNLDEALGMIEQAVAAQPDNGAIVDSLGWVLYRLGRYTEAVGHLEKAASLEATDPVINDHLGDVYWSVGREIEARFQWQRALSFDPEPEEANRIRRKLADGLDAVLAKEGADPLRVARDDR